ncbi:MAG: hypothetical protein EB127_05895 [Alphaproteobacteria bacterium]|nr:hypothetical protein [Alphaproteobacteria bacterium]
MTRKYLCKVSGAYLRKEELFRLVLAPNNSLCMDPSFELVGPTMMVTKDENFAHAWLESSCLSDHFGVNLTKDEAVNTIVRFLYSRILSFVALAKKSGALYIGRPQVELGLKKRGDKLIVQAYDASMNEKFVSTAVEIIEIFSAEKLSMILGKDMVKYVCVFGDFANTISELYRKYKFFNEQR